MFVLCTLLAVALAPVAIVAQAPSTHSTPTPPPPAPPQSVVVTNTTAQPVPTVAQGTTAVNGTVNIGNTPSVTLAGTPNVALAPGASVNVTNPVNGVNQEPLLVTEARNRWEDTCTVTFSGVSGSCLFRTVPANTVLVVRAFSAFGGVDTGVRPVSLTLQTTVSHYFPATVMATNAGGFDYLATHQETWVYVNQNNPPGCDIILSGVSNSGNYQCSISGYLVPLF